MTQLTKIVGLELLSKSDLKICGSIKSALFDVFCKKIAYFVVETINGSIVLPYSAVKSIKDAVVVDNLVETMPLVDIDVTSFCQVLEKRIFLSGGDCLGTVVDVIFDDKGKVSSLKIGEDKNLTYQIAGIGDFILVKDAVKKQKNKAVRMPKATLDTPVFALSDNIDDSTADLYENSDTPAEDSYENSDSPAESFYEKSTAKILSAEKTQSISDTSQADGEPVPIKLNDALRGIELAQEEDHIPPRIICDYNFLLSRTLMADLCSYNGELLASKGTPVTVELVETARRHGKLIDLTLSSK